MSGDEDQPVSSEELIRRARESVAPGTDVPGDGPDEAEGHTELPTADSGVEIEGDEPATAYPSDMATAGLEPEPTATSPADPAAPPEPEAPEEPESTWARMWRWARWVVPAVAVGWFAFSVLTAGEPVDTLDIGECFMEEAGEEITGVDTVDCAESHDLELFAKIEITGFGEEYPGNDALVEWLGPACSREFEDYVGFDFFASDYWVYTITPAEEVWEDGDYLGLCALYLGDFAGNILSSTGSARNAGH